MNKKIWLTVAVIAIGIVVLPTTIAMFAGQHNFYDTITNPTSAVPCLKCHQDVYDEITTPGSGAVNAVHAGLSSGGGCDACHATIAPGKEGLTRGVNGQFHAAAAPACLDCHGSTGPGLSADTIVNGTAEVHKAFVNQSFTAQFLKGANEACISCHTHIIVNITWTKATTITFNSTETVLPDGNHSWIVGNFNATGTNVTTTSGS